MDENAARGLFERYGRLFNQALRGEVNMDELTSLYGSDVIGAGPLGMNAAKNDEAFRQALMQGFARYREIGTREVRLGDVGVSPINEHHALVCVPWRAIYDRGDEPDKAIDFEVHYLIQQARGETKIFGWITGDEQALLREHGIV